MTFTNLRNILPDDIIDKKILIALPVNDINDKIEGKFTTTGEFFIKRQSG